MVEREVVIGQEVRKSLLVKLISRFAGVVRFANDGKCVVVVQIGCR